MNPEFLKAVVYAFFGAFMMAVLVGVFRSIRAGKEIEKGWGEWTRRPDAPQIFQAREIAEQARWDA